MSTADTITLETLLTVYLEGSEVALLYMYNVRYWGKLRKNICLDVGAVYTADCERKECRINFITAARP